MRPQGPHEKALIQRGLGDRPGIASCSATWELWRASRMTMQLRMRCMKTALRRELGDQWGIAVLNNLA